MTRVEDPCIETQRKAVMLQLSESEYAAAQDDDFTKDIRIFLRVCVSVYVFLHDYIGRRRVFPVRE